jgi:hypothetical protein
LQVGIFVRGKKSVTNKKRIVQKITTKLPPSFSTQITIRNIQLYVVKSPSFRYLPKIRGIGPGIMIGYFIALYMEHPVNKNLLSSSSTSSSSSTQTVQLWR